EPLKAFASTHPRARNASVEFDAATLAPTFRLRYGQPGQSYALSIAARLGLGAALIARAQSHRTAQQARMSELLAWLDEHTRCEAERTLAIERREQEAVARLTDAREVEASARVRADALIAQARAEASDLVEHYLDDAFLAGLGRVRFVHGKGTGALRKAVRDLLAAHPLVDSFRDGEPSEGGAGATVAALKVS